MFKTLLVGQLLKIPGKAENGRAVILIQYNMQQGVWGKVGERKTLFSIYLNCDTYRKVNLSRKAKEVASTGGEEVEGDVDDFQDL